MDVSDCRFSESEIIRLHQYTLIYVQNKTFLAEGEIKQLVQWVTETTPGKTKEVRQYIKEQLLVNRFREPCSISNISISMMGRV